MKVTRLNFESIAKRAPARDRTIVDSYTGTWQQALCPRRLPTEGEVYAIAECGDAREWDDFRRALAESGNVLLMTQRTDRENRSIGVVAPSNPRHAGEVMIW